MRHTLAVGAAVAVLGPSPAQAQDPDPWLGPDKALHFGVSAGLAGGTYLLSGVALPDDASRLGLALGVSLGAGLGKELYDLTGRGTPSWKDLTWDVAGVAAGLLVGTLLDRLLDSQPRHGAWRVALGR